MSHAPAGHNASSAARPEGGSGSKQGVDKAARVGARPGGFMGIGAVYRQPPRAVAPEFHRSASRGAMPTTRSRQPLRLLATRRARELLLQRVGAGTHDGRSRTMNASAWSCGVSGLFEQLFGKGVA